MESLRRLQGLYQDLFAFSETRLANVDRLWGELEASVDELRRLLEKSAKSGTSRDSLAKGESLPFLIALDVGINPENRQD